jgi:hypothetical protein
MIGGDKPRCASGVQEIAIMFRHRLWLLAAVVMAVCHSASWAGADIGKPKKKAVAAIDAKALAERIDALLAARWNERGVKPATPADDAEFLRRVYLALSGKIPPVSEVRKFLDDRSTDKRARAIERLLGRMTYVTHFTRYWRHLMLPEAEADDRLAGLIGGFDAWLHERLLDNAPYDRIVRELLTAPVEQANGGQFGNVIVLGGGGRPSGPVNPLNFYLAKDAKPENLAASASRLFLGIRIECAQCHDHPFAQWKREQFWSQAAFFAGIQRQQQGNLRELPDRRELAIPGNDRTVRVVQAGFLDGTEPKWKFKVGARVTLADWMTKPDNPFFARAAVNRMWAYFFGTGLVEPIDNFNDQNPPSHPELLDELARQFVANKFDLKYLMRAITLSKAYQITSATTGPGQDDPRLFARMAVLGLTPEQLIDSLTQATGYRGDARGELLAKFPASERQGEFRMSIPQALALMNSRLTADATSPERSNVLAAVADMPWDTDKQIEALYLAAFSRKPRAEELTRFVRYVDRAKGDKKKALSDVFWALLNSTEFIVNH